MTDVEAPSELPVEVDQVLIPAEAEAGDPPPPQPDVPAPLAATTEREIERKLRVPALFTMPPIVGDNTGVSRVVARPPIVLSATYFDTDDLRLARWGITLRRREGGGDAGWHLKLPVAGGHSGDRDEVQLPLSAGEPTSPPRELTELVTALVRGVSLRPVAALRTERTPFLLRSPDDRLLAELVDDVVSVLDGERVAGRFREIEVEARDATAADLDMILAVLQAAGAEPGTTSKAAHALGPRATAPPDVPVPSAPTPRGPSSVAVHAHLLTQTRRLLLNDVRMRRDLPDAVHQMRVAARRLRSSLRTFRPLLDRDWADSLREDLGWVAEELGLIRDTEVLLKRLVAHCDQIPDPTSREATRSLVTDTLTKALDSSRVSALTALGSPRYLAVLEHLVTSSREPRFTETAYKPARKVLPELSWNAWSQLRDEASGLDHDVAAEHWHRTRITAKRARYAAEALEPVFGSEASLLAASLEDVTELLGEHQDSSVARDLIVDLAHQPGLGGPEGWGLGLLHGIEVQCERDARDRFPSVWERAMQAHQRSPLR